ncbi:hypothetical protein DH86_00002469, partial [Scytalidium sp. 3C]
GKGVKVDGRGKGAVVGLPGARRQRRLARRGGVKRISATVYEETRLCIKQYLEKILHDCVAYVDHGKRKTVTVTDVGHLPMNF